MTSSQSYKLLLADNMYLASYDSCNDIDLYGIENLCYCYGITGSIYEYWYLQKFDSKIYLDIRVFLDQLN